VQLVASGLEVNVAERLKTADLKLWEFDKHAAVSSEALQINMALAIEIRAHLLHLEVGHVTYASAQSALMSPGAAELETLKQTPVRQQLTGGTDNLAKTRIACEDADNVCAAGNPDQSLVLFGLQLSTGVDLEKLRVQRSLKEAECELVNSYIDLRRFHNQRP